MTRPDWAGLPRGHHFFGTVAMRRAKFGAFGAIVIDSTEEVP
jgi:hypothetical protein